MRSDPWTPFSPLSHSRTINSQPPPPLAEALPTAMTNPSHTLPTNVALPGFQETFSGAHGIFCSQMKLTNNCKRSCEGIQ